MIRFAILFVLLLGINTFTGALTTKNSEIANLDQEKTGSRYCIVVGSFSSLVNARRYGASVQAKRKDYEVTYRDNGNGFYRVCLFRFMTGAEAKKRIQELLADKLFKQAWVLAYKERADKITTKTQLSENVVKTEGTVKGIKLPPGTSIKITTPEPAPKEVISPVQQERTHMHYCLVVGNYASANEAKEVGSTLQNNGYGYTLFFRKSENDTYYVCMYNLKTKPDAEKRLDKMQHIDGIFANAWVLGYDIVRENISIDKL
jgi:hypothetical protein